MYKGYKIRLYPTKEQEELFWKHIHAARFVYNYLLEKQINNKSNNLPYISKFNMIRMIPKIRSEFEWLMDISQHSLQGVCANLHHAFSLFYSGVSRYPVFKSKKYSKQSFYVRAEHLYFADKNYANIEKCGKVYYKTDYKFPLGRGMIKACHSSIECISGKWILSFAMECESQALNNLSGSMGIDLGIKELAVVSHNGQTQVFHNINKSKKMRGLEKRRKWLQRKASLKYNKNGKIKSSNYLRLQAKIRRMYNKQVNIRSDYILQTISKLINLHPARIVIEDLSIKSMLKNKWIRKDLLDQKLAFFIEKLKYKADEYGIHVVVADRFYPSSKTCSCCGHIKKDLKLSDRTYICEKCGLNIDRDENAAKNLEKYVA